MKAPRRTPVYIFKPTLGDLMYGVTIPYGTRVHKCQGACVGNAPYPFQYVKHADTGEHLGMVMRKSLELEQRNKASDKGK